MSPRTLAPTNKTDYTTPNFKGIIIVKTKLTDIFFFNWKWINVHLKLLSVQYNTLNSQHRKQKVDIF